MKDEKNIHGFKVPDSYFESFEERLLKRLASKKLPNETGFKVPDDYFINLEDKVMARYKASEETQKVIPLFRRKNLAYISAVAASIIIILSVVLTNSDATATFSSIDPNSIEMYIIDGNLELDSDEVMALLSNESINELENAEAYFSEENIENYLLDSLDDTNILIE
ncbi:hypothetical protein [Ulvibacter antarcticus]|uniref:Uncharacterized protein n=1 Tax=Ulvibacter antarcticus TaxID=442714 RepID=A0A3L9YZX1_9FLAO|nr:hypothetical protein [Ulvibacter antarcticus]RMA64659.1 hypothetical protein BXY75_1538 [Ulvibacter antarcticus]